MKQAILGFLACLPLAACGVGETAISAAAGGASDEYRAHDLRLHVAIADLSGSASLVDAIAKMQTQLSDLLGAFPIVEASLRHSDQQHHAIVKAIQRGQAVAARQQMEVHVDATAKLIRGLVG